MTDGDAVAAVPVCGAGLAPDDGPAAAGVVSVVLVKVPDWRSSSTGLSGHDQADLVVVLDQGRGLDEPAVADVLTVDEKEAVEPLETAVGGGGGAVLICTFQINSYTKQILSTIKCTWMSTMNIPGSLQFPLNLRPSCFPGCLSRVTVNSSSHLTLLLPEDLRRGESHFSDNKKCEL